MKSEKARAATGPSGWGFETTDCGSHNLNYSVLMPKRAVKLGPDAVRQFKALGAAERAEALALSQNKRFWKLIDDAIARGKKEGFVDLADL